MDKNNQLGALDLLTIFSTVLGVANYEENLSQTAFQVATEEQTKDIHRHLQEQDEKINKILELLGKGV